MKRKQKCFSILIILSFLFFSLTSCTSSKSLHISNWDAFRKEWTIETRKIGFMSGYWDLDWFDFQILLAKSSLEQKRDGIKNFVGGILNWNPSPIQREKSIQSFNRFVNNTFQSITGEQLTAEEIVSARHMGKNIEEAKGTFWSLIGKCKLASQP